MTDSQPSIQVYISFPEAFWLRDHEDQNVQVQGFITWLAPNYALSSNPERWMQEVVELGSLPGETSHPTLLFYIYGPQSKYITTKLAQLASPAERNEFIFGYFRPYYSRLPHYSEHSPECRPLACLATEWLHDELAGHGSYSNFQVGLEDGDEDIRVMRQGLPDRRLWLAGEHTAPFLGLGTATGAYWSGEAVGRRIAVAYGQITPESALVEDQVD